MQKMITLSQFKDLPLSMQKIMMRWWTVSQGDLYVRSYNDRLPDIEVVNRGNLDKIKELKNKFAMSNEPYSKVYPIFTEYHLRKFLSDFGYKMVAKTGV